MNRIRLATVEEVKSIAPVSDLDESCLVFALDTQQGTPLGVVRTVVEIDPVVYPETWKGNNERLKMLFQRDLETIIFAKGAPKYYFNVHADDKKMVDAMATLGAENISTAPEFRFRKRL